MPDVEAGPQARPGRDLKVVIDEMLEVIPLAEVGLRRRLLDVGTSSLYAPPEGQNLHWVTAAGILTEEVGDPAREGAPAWAQTVAGIFSGQRERERLQELTHDLAKIRGWEESVRKLPTREFTLYGSYDSTDEEMERVLGPLPGAPELVQGADGSLTYTMRVSEIRGLADGSMEGRTPDGRYVRLDPGLTAQFGPALLAQWNTGIIPTITVTINPPGPDDGGAAPEPPSATETPGEAG